MSRLDPRPGAARVATTGVIGTIGTLALTLSVSPASAATADPRPTTRDQTRIDAPTLTPVPRHAASPATYTVHSGDTLWDISERVGVELSALRAANGLEVSTLIHPGQVLVLPGGSARAAGSSVPEPPAASPAPAGSAYEVSAGDTLWAIADAHGVSLDALLQANGLGRDAIIYPGQTLAIPGADAVLQATRAAVATPVPTAAPSTDLDAEQIENARTIIRVGRELGVPDRGIAIALATAMVESWIRNLDWGDRDSLGLFQQRPSTGWGTPDQVRDPVRSTTAFFEGVSGPDGLITRGLLDVPGWESMDFAAAAQAVQVSAYPERYGPWEQTAYAWLAALG
ncbi:LysM repeat protein [Microbacterium sp. AG790]|uniref:LysM peptidoglycan-binding domain-containing protein n=1 Tax=Microbacterium sp. AG790 TaxID=2183995 RepID=UPI000EB1DE1B|nr:LysM peptidoglycan-binding domain-containing protein [Microbacterium sp. AG790]RKS89342.1 LysM repeat protein [Microbacterium sp. AG790]